MTIQPWQVPGSASASFQDIINPIWPEMADIAVANLTAIDPSEFEAGATPAATWTAELYETELAFKARIIAALVADGTLTGSPPGALVLIYSRGGFWGRNTIGALLAPVPA